MVDERDIYRSDNAGDNWTKMTKGLPKEMGKVAVLVSPADYEAQQEILTKTENAVREIHGAVNTMRNAKEQIETLQSTWKSDTTMKAWQISGKDLIKKITIWEDDLITPKPQTFQDIINFPNHLNAALLDLRGRASNHDPRPTQGVQERLAELLTERNMQRRAMQKIMNEDLAKFNADYKARQLPAVYIKAREK